MRQYVPEEQCLHTQECAILRKRGDFRLTKKYGGDSGAGTTMFAKALSFRKNLMFYWKEMLRCWSMYVDILIVTKAGAVRFVRSDIDNEINTVKL